jgi:hypothetical protein
VRTKPEANPQQCAIDKVLVDFADALSRSCDPRRVLLRIRRKTFSEKRLKARFELRGSLRNRCWLLQLFANGVGGGMRGCNSYNAKQ